MKVLSLLAGRTVIGENSDNTYGRTGYKKDNHPSDRHQGSSNHKRQLRERHNAKDLFQQNLDCAPVY